MKLFQLKYIISEKPSINVKLIKIGIQKDIVKQHRIQRSIVK
jgi:hypothetical protein